MVLVLRVRLHVVVKRSKPRISVFHQCSLHWLCVLYWLVYSKIQNSHLIYIELSPLWKKNPNHVSHKQSTRARYVEIFKVMGILGHAPVTRQCRSHHRVSTGTDCAGRVAIRCMTLCRWPRIYKRPSGACWESVSSHASVGEGTCLDVIKWTESIRLCLTSPGAVSPSMIQLHWV